MKAPGFILIELLISLLIAALLSVGMMNSLTMVFKTNEIMDSLMDLSARSIRLQQQLERDLSGIFIPPSLFIKPSDAQKTPASDNKPGQTSVVSASKKAPEEQKNKHLFFATKKDGNTDILTFITTNPLASFWSDTAGQAQSRVVRVVYRLEQDKNNPSLFRLMRQEGMELDFQKYTPEAKKQIRALEVMSGVKSFSMSFMVEDESENKDKANMASVAPGDPSTQAPVGSESKKTIIYKKLDEWRDQEKKDEKKQKKETKIPRFVQLKTTLMDTQKKREEAFEFMLPIFSDGDPVTKKEKPALQKSPIQQGKPGGIRQRLMQASHKPKTRPGGLLGQFTQSLGART